MDAHRCDRLTRTLTRSLGRRRLLTGTSALGASLIVGAAGPHEAEAQQGCRKNGTRCTQKQGTKRRKRCQRRYCLRTPFTIEARWETFGADHDTYLFVPNQSGASLPFPYIDYTCTPAASACGDDAYPFTCVSQDAEGPGDEVTTVRRLLSGTYEYWIELFEDTPAGDLEVLLRNANGRLVRAWTSPANPEVLEQVGWHVFSIHGATGSITPVNLVASTTVPEVHSPNSAVCP